MTKNVELDAMMTRLERFWDSPDGYFFKLRQGDYDHAGTQRVEETLRSIQVAERTELPRRLVALTWIIPTFMEWQIERVGTVGGDVESLRSDITRLRNALEELLGTP